jgi:hypothetical protein
LGVGIDVCALDGGRTANRVPHEQVRYRVDRFEVDRDEVRLLRREQRFGDRAVRSAAGDDRTEVREPILEVRAGWFRVRGANQVELAVVERYVAREVGSPQAVHVDDVTA